MFLTFNKINTKWYVDLPDWEGDFDDLEMVNGADTLLEILAQRLNKQSIMFEIWTADPGVPCARMSKIEETLDGATYQVSNCLYYSDTAWLCNVTKFVFGGYHPRDIYFKVANLDIEDKEKDAPETGNIIDYKKMKVTAVSLAKHKAVTVTADMKKLCRCKTEAALRKAIDDLILELKVFTKSDLPTLKYQGRKEVIEEWKVVHPLASKSVVKEETSPQSQPASASSGYNLDRFLRAQRTAYSTALEEIRDGQKRSHWIWYIFPQQKGLGRSYNSEFYGLDGLGEAKAYLQHPVLGQRLREICQALLDNRGKDIHYIMGSDIDVLKLKTSMHLFDHVSPNDIFSQVLKAF